MSIRNIVDQVSEAASLVEGALFKPGHEESLTPHYDNMFESMQTRAKILKIRIDEMKSEMTELNKAITAMSDELDILEKRKDK